jgi:tRNA pseudouridine38-40 synthase
MQRNICLIIEYDGTGYYGLQIQKKRSKNKFPTVQHEIQKALRRLFNMDIGINYSGRTDRGVHAKHQVVNFRIKTGISLLNIKKALNSFLPADIYIKKIESQPLGFHARYSVKSKIYRYIILNSKKYDVFERKYSWQVKEPLDINFMQECGSDLTGEKDFSLFALQPGKYKSCLRRLEKIKITKRGRFILIDIQAEGFLRGMARYLTGFLVQAGRHRITAEDIRKIFKTNSRNNLFKPAPAQGLYLWKVFY